MGIETPNDIERAAIEEHAQHMVEQTALRKVRKTLDKIEEAEADRRETLRYVLIACAILALIAAWFLWGLIFSGRDFPKQPATNVPSAVPQTSEGRAQPATSPTR